MANGVVKMSVLCLAVLMLPILASGQGVKCDLVLEKTFTDTVRRVGISYPPQGRPLFTIVGSETVVAMDGDGNTSPIESGLGGFDWATCSPNGQHVGIVRGYTEIDSLTSQPYLKYQFTLKDRNGSVIWVLSDSSFNDIWVGNNGWVAGTFSWSFTVLTPWRLYDPSGGFKGQITTDDLRFFGGSGSFFTWPGPIAAYTADLTQLWSFDPVSPSLQPEALQISSDGLYFVRSSKQGLEFYENGNLVGLDSTLAGLDAQFHPVVITPDDRHALVSAKEQARLYDLNQCNLIRAYDAVEPRQFGWGSASWNGDYVLLNMVGDPAMPDSTVLFDQNGDAAWGVELPLAHPEIPSLSMDPQAKYIVVWDPHKLWLYERQ